MPITASEPLGVTSGIPSPPGAELTLVSPSECKMQWDRKRRKGVLEIIILPCGRGLYICRLAFPVGLPGYIPVHGTHEGHLIDWFTSGFT